jgi:hypothetical protein
MTFQNQIQQKRQNLDIETQWEFLLGKLAHIIGKKPENLDAVLFLIGVQELGQGKRHFTKEQKQDLMHIATCKVLSKLGFYTLKGLDQDGWPHWEAMRSLPKLSLEEQDKLLKTQVIEYFEEEEIF